MKKKLLLAILVLSVFSGCQTPGNRTIASGYSISKSAKQLVDWETRANAVGTRSNQVLEIEHFEIPYKFLQKNIDDTVDPAVLSSLVFEKNGEKYVRWIINPEDTKWHLELAKFLEKNNLDSKTYKFFDAYLTASRSMIVVNPENGATFSLKVSTNHTGGNWTDKKQTWVDAKQVRNMNNWMGNVLATMKTETLQIMEEPIAFGVEGIDQGMIMRSLNDLPSDKFFYMPGFSALHSQEGARIAKLNGAKNVAAFWDQHYNRPLARASAEFFAYTGAWFDSPHSQNFLVELDKNYKPTGRIVFRDLGDTFLLEDFANNTRYKHLLPLWEDGNVKKAKLHSAVGLLHGNKAPEWITKETYTQLANSFYEAFEERFSEISGVSIEELRNTKVSVSDFSYASKYYPTTATTWTTFLRYANCFNGETRTLTGIKCPDFFTKRHKPNTCASDLSAILLGI